MRLSQEKRQARQIRKLNDRLRRQRRRQEIRCWFTWPFRHEYEASFPQEGMKTLHVCVGCGKEREW